MAARNLTVEEIMAILPGTVPRLAALTAELTADQLRAPPAPGNWSVNDVLAHLRACHDVLGGNVLRILAEDHPAWRGMSPRAWMRKTDYPAWEFRPAFEAFTRQRSELLAALEQLPGGAWERTARVTGMVGDVHEYSARFYASWMASHERGHLRSLPRIIRAVAGTG
jgi:DinB superfamily